MSEHTIPDDLTEWLKLEAADRRKQADARLQYAASGKNLSPADRKAAQLIAEQMAGRKLPKSNAVQEEAHAQEQERIAKKLNSQAEKIEGFVERIAKLEAERDRLEGLTAELSADAGIQAFVDSFEGIKAENAQLRAALARIQQPVTDEELVLFQGNEPTKSARAIARACRRFADKLLAARAAGKGHDGK